MKLILGSKSQGRQRVLKRAGFEFEVMVADIDEKAIRDPDYKRLPLLIARAKTEALLSKITEPALLITSDQVVICNNELREKPEDKTQAREYLRSYKQYPAQTVTAVVVTNTTNGKRAEGTDVAMVYLDLIPEKTIDTLIEQGGVYHWAGGYAVEDPLIKPFVKRISGEKESVTGLPLKLTLKLLKEVQS